MLVFPPGRAISRAVTALCLTFGLFFGLTALGVATAGDADAQAADGLEVSSSKTYTPDPENERIDVVATYSMSNVQADEVVGNSIRSFFFTNWVIALPANVINFAATSSGQPLITSIDPDSDTNEVVFGTINLPFNLNYEQSVSIDVSYTIPSGEPRAEGAVTRVNDSFLSFSVWAIGDPGDTSVRINVPEGFTFEFQGDLAGLTLVDSGSESYYQTNEIDDPRSFFGRVFGRNDTGLLVETVELPNATATVRAWPDDPEWVDFVVDAIEDDVPIMEDLTGLDWPAGDIEIIETVTPYLYGYGGWFNADSGVIEVGENLERDLILHELSHAWFNDDLIAGRWITEGLAEEFASQVIAASGDPLPNPERPDLTDPLRVPLAAWANPWTLTEEDAFDYEQYHYNASWWVIRQITDQVGLDTFAEVLVALDQDEMAYKGEGPIETTPLKTDWWHLFDLLETRAGASDLDELFETYVLIDVEAAKFELRDATLQRYDDLLSRSLAWGPPLAIRYELSAWNFESAIVHLDHAEQILAIRDETDTRAEALGVTITHDAEIAYETATSVDDLIEAQAIVQRQFDELGDLQNLRAAIDRRANELGLVVMYPSADFGGAVNYASDLEQTVETLADLRAATEARASDLGVTNPAWPASAEETDLVAAAALADARMATLDTIATAESTVDRPRSFIERVGLWRADPAGAIDEAKAAFEADALDDALAASGRAEALISTAAASGRSRLTWAAIATAVALIAVLSIAFTRRSRRDTPPAATP